MDNKNVVHIQHYSAVRKNELMKFTGKWMELGKIILNEVTHAERQKKALVVLFHLQMWICNLEYLKKNGPWGSAIEVERSGYNLFEGRNGKNLCGVLIMEDEQR